MHGDDGKDKNGKPASDGNQGAKGPAVSRRSLLQSGAVGALAATGAGQLLGDNAGAHGSDSWDRDHRDTLERLTRSNRDPKRRILLKGGMVLSMDPAVGDFVKADVLIEGKKIKEVRPNIKVSNATVVDASDTIVMPGFIDTHCHLFQSNLRAFFADAHYFASNLYPDYRRGSARGGAFERYEPKDAYWGEYVGALGQINGGVTTLCDTSQVSITPAHSDACVKAFIDSGLRSVFAYSSAPGNAADTTAYPQDLRRLKQKFFSSKDQLVTVALSTAPDAVRYQLARELDVPIFTHVNSQATAAAVEALPMKSDQTYIHCTLLNPTNWQKMHDTGGKVSLATISESSVGVATPAIQEALDAGMQSRTSFGTDTESFMTSDFFSQTRTAFTTQRLLALRASNNGAVNVPRVLSCREVLEMATMGGARGAHLDHKVGSLTPGKEADIILLRTDKINVSPVCNVPGAIVTLMDTSNVDTVFIAGNVRKWKGDLVDVNVAKIHEKVTESRDGILQRTGWALELFGTCCPHQ